MSDKPSDNREKSKGQKKLPKRLSERYLKNSGEYYLNRFPASSAHFLTVMTRKIDRSCRAHPDQTREEWITHVRDVVIPYFKELGFLNDDLYSKALFNSLKRKGLSRSMIANRMRHKGVESDIIANLLNDDDDGASDKESVIRFAQKKKIGKYRTSSYDDPKDKQKDLAKLARAGFSYDVAMSVFS